MIAFFYILYVTNLYFFYFIRTNKNNKWNSLIQNIFLVLNSSEFCVCKQEQDKNSLLLFKNFFLCHFVRNKIKLFLRFFHRKMHQALTFSSCKTGTRWNLSMCSSNECVDLSSKNNRSLRKESRSGRRKWFEGTQQTRYLNMDGFVFPFGATP